MSLFDEIGKYITPETIGALASSLGSEKGKTQSAVSAAVPVIVGMLAKNASKPQGAESLDRALDKDHDGSVLQDVVGALSKGGDQKQGNGILEHVLGGKRANVEEEVGKQSGLDMAQVAQILAAVAPLVMGALGKKKKEEGLDASGVAAQLQADKAVVADKVEEPGFLTKLLDQDKDGDVTDDLAGIGASLLNAFSKK